MLHYFSKIAFSIDSLLIIIINCIILSLVLRRAPRRLGEESSNGGWVGHLSALNLDGGKGGEGEVPSGGHSHYWQSKDLGTGAQATAQTRQAKQRECTLELSSLSLSLSSLLATDAKNKSSLEYMEQCLFVLCLDDFVTPRVPTKSGYRNSIQLARMDMSYMASMLLHAGGSTLHTANRWFDKFLQVCSFLLHKTAV